MLKWLRKGETFDVAGMKEAATSRPTLKPPSFAGKFNEIKK